MNGSTHIDLSLVAAETVKWPGDRKLLARSAAFPDEVATVYVEGVGAHLFGRNLESLKHFCKLVDGKPQGYGLQLDPSLPHLDISRKLVESRPGGWPWPVTPTLAQNEPFAILMRDLAASHSNCQADEVTYTAASTMAHWCEVVLRSLPPEFAPESKQKAMDTVAGWALHFIEDCCVPHHAGGMLLAGHAEFEAEQQVMWERLRSKNMDVLTTLSSGAAVLNPYTHRDPPSETIALRALAERCAKQSFVGRRTIWWRRWFWRKGWRSMMLDSLTRGLDAAIVALRNIQAVTS